MLLLVLTRLMLDLLYFSLEFNVKSRNFRLSAKRGHFKGIFNLNENVVWEDFKFEKNLRLASHQLFTPSKILPI